MGHNEPGVLAQGAKGHFVAVSAARTEILGRIECDRARLLLLLPDIYSRLSAEIKAQLSFKQIRGWFPKVNGMISASNERIHITHFAAVKASLESLLQEGGSARLARADATQLAPDILASLMQEFDGAMNDGTGIRGGVELMDIPARFAAYQMWKRRNSSELAGRGIDRLLQEVVGNDQVTELAPAHQGKIVPDLEQELHPQLQLAPVAQVAVIAEEKISLSGMKYTDFSNMVAVWVGHTHVSLEMMVTALPPAMRAAARLKQAEENKRPVPFELIGALRNLYQQMPHSLRPAVKGDKDCDVPFKGAFFCMMDAKVAYEQIAATIAARPRHISFSQKKVVQSLVKEGFPERSICLLLDPNPVARKSVPRRLVAALLEQISYGPVNTQLDTEMVLLPMAIPDHVIEVGSLRENLNEIFGRVAIRGITPRDAYKYMPRAYQSALPFKEVAGWLDGSIILADRDKADMYLKATITVTEHAPPL